MATKTITDVKYLIINYLTEEQYQEAAAAGEINENELYMTPGDKYKEKLDSITYILGKDENGVYMQLI
jgi:hypothetical protein